MATATHSKRRRRVAVGGLLCLLLASCSNPVSGQGNLADNVTGPGGARTGPVLMARTLAAMKRASAYHVVAAGTDGDGTAIRADVRFGATSSSGSLSQGREVLQIRTINGKVYFMASDAFWRSELPAGEGSAVAPLFHGKWVTDSLPNTAFAELAHQMTRSAFVSQLTSQHPSSDFALAARSVSNGAATIGLRDKSDGSLIEIAATGTPFPLSSTSAPHATDGHGTITFSQWDVPFTATAPPAGQILDIATLH